MSDEQIVHTDEGRRTKEEQCDGGTMSKICGTVDETLRRWRLPISHTFTCFICKEQHTEHFLPQSTSVRKTIRKVQWLLSLLKGATVYKDIVRWQPEPICQGCVGRLPL